MALVTSASTKTLTTQWDRSPLTRTSQGGHSTPAIRKLIRFPLLLRPTSVPYSDAVGGNPRTLLERFDIPDGVTIESCTAVCAANGFNITGLEFGQECCEFLFDHPYTSNAQPTSFIGCGSSFLVDGTEAPLGECSRACEADHSELCGASSRLSVYVVDAVNTTTTTEPTVTPTPTTTTDAPATTAPTTTEEPTTTTSSI